MGVSVGGTTWYINRFSENMSFNNYENITGAGNFSRYNRMNGISDIDFTEKSSAVRGGNLSLDQQTRFFSREGPVVISYNLNSLVNRVKTTSGKTKTNVIESANVKIDEVWPFYFVNYKKLHYTGHGIRNSEIYDSNGDIISTSSDAYRLQKESAYATFNNRTLINTNVYPSVVFEDRASNKSSSYVLTMKSIGSLSSLDVTKGRPTDERITRHSNENVVQVSQEYRGLVDMNLKIASKETVPLKKYEKISCEGGACAPYGETCDDVADYLPCCMEGYSGMTSFDRQHLSADCIFNSYPAYLAVPSLPGKAASLDTSRSPAAKQPAVVAETEAVSSAEPETTLKRPSETAARAAKETSVSLGSVGRPALRAVLPNARAIEKSSVGAAIDRPVAKPEEDRYYEEMRSD